MIEAMITKIKKGASFITRPTTKDTPNGSLTIKISGGLSKSDKLANSLKTQPEGAIKNVKPIATTTCGAERSIVIIANFLGFTTLYRKMMQKLKANTIEIAVATIPVNKVVMTAVTKPGTMSKVFSGLAESPTISKYGFCPKMLTTF